MHILLIPPAAGPPLAANHVLVEHLRAAGHTVSVHAGAPGLRSLLKAIREADHVVLEDRPGAVVLAAVQRIFLRKTFVVLVTRHVRHGGLRWSPVRWIYVAALRGAAAVLVFNTGARNALIKDGVPRARLRLLPPPVEAAPTLAQTPASGRRVVTGIASGAPQTAALLLRVLALVLECEPGVELVVRGPASALDPLEDRIRTLGLEANVILTPEELEAPACGIALLVHAPGEPVAARFAFDALGAGQALVLPSIAPFSDWLKDGETACIVPTGDEIAAADAVLRLLAQPVLAQRLAAAGHARAQANHRYQEIVTAICAISSDPLLGFRGAITLEKATDEIIAEMRDEG